MADGDLIDAHTGDDCYLVEFEGILIGGGDPWWVTVLDGLGAVTNTGDRQPHTFAASTASGIHVARPGGIVFTAIAGLNDPAAMEEALAELEDAWTITTPRRTPMVLHLLVPHRGHVSVRGWPDQLVPTRVFAAGGVASVVCTFSRTDTVYTPHNGGS